jgi:hypothetical protein
MRDLKIFVASVCGLLAMGACGNCGAATTPAASTPPSAADLAAAVVGGRWALTVTVDPYTGPPPPSTIALKPGHTATDTVTFVSQCAATGGCTLQLWGPDGPDASKAAYYWFYSSSTGLEGPPVSKPMTETGATYSQTIPIGGFGGFECAPSRTVPRPEQTLSLTVVDATRGTSGWAATRMTGTERLLAGWGCSGGAFSGWRIGQLKISGRPA